jgi:Peptidase family C25
MKSKKLVITSKENLALKYGKGFTAIKKTLAALIKSDKKIGFQTTVIYLDEPASAKKAGIKPLKAVTPQAVKESIDLLYHKHIPAYILLLGAQDVIPFVEISNPADDEDAVVPSDLPYACEKPYSKNINDFTGPTRVVGRLPDVPGSNDHLYLVGAISNVIKSKPVDAKTYADYFAITCDEWKISTRLSLKNIFGSFAKLQISPPAGKKYTAAQLKPLTHFYNCHGASNDFAYYGQKGKSYPQAIHTLQLDKKITYGTIVAAECCYGAELVDNTMLGVDGQVSICNQYLKNGALAFMGSSTIAYGPVDGQGLADLITQYFIRYVHDGASTGRAMLEARQKFITESGPSLDPYELKTLAQFNLMGDPSILPVKPSVAARSAVVKENTIHNNRINLFNKGVNLKTATARSVKQATVTPSKNAAEINSLLKQTHFTNADRKGLYKVESSSYKAKAVSRGGKALVNTPAKFRTFIKETSQPADKIKNIRILVVKETNEDVLGWKIYVSR